MGMEKLGTKGPTFITPITMRTKFSLSFSFRNKKRGSLEALDLENARNK
jgi:hypothetical protein